MEPLNNGGQLLDQLATAETLTESHIASIIQTVLKAIDYVHGKGYAHGDLRPQNIWVPDDKNFTGLKLSGFSAD